MLRDAMRLLRYISGGGLGAIEDLISDEKVSLYASLLRMRQVKHEVSFHDSMTDNGALRERVAIREAYAGVESPMFHLRMRAGSACTRASVPRCRRR